MGDVVLFQDCKEGGYRLRGNLSASIEKRMKLNLTRPDSPVGESEVDGDICLSIRVYVCSNKPNFQSSGIFAPLI